MNDVWDGIDRRKSADLMQSGQDSEMWRYVVAQLESTNAKLGAIHIDMVGHKADMQHMQQDVEEIKRAFPKADDGSRDYHGHHNHHDDIIKTSKKWSEIGTDVSKKVFGGIAWIVIVFIALAVWERIKATLRVGP